MTRNVVLICLDTVRKDYFDEYAPRLQELSDVSFEQCRAASAWSTPSHASMMTGELPHKHGIHTHNRKFHDLSREDTFLGELNNYVAMGASANVYASSTFGFDTIFDKYSDVAPHRRYPSGMDMEKFIQERESSGSARYIEFLREALNHQHTFQSLANGGLFKLNDILRRAPVPKLLDDGASIVTREALSMVDDVDEPYFLFTNFMDAHGPVHHVFGYDRDLHSAPNTWTSFEFDDWEINVEGPSEKHRQDIQNHRELYSAAINYLDQKVSVFIKEVQEKSEQETTFIITADHGENLAYKADNDLFGHTSSLTESLLHVPCYIVNPPSGYESSIQDYFSHLDLGELIIRMAREETPSVVSDQIFAELVGGGVGGMPEDPEDHDYWDRMLRCAYEDEQKFVWDSLGGTAKYRIDHSRPCWQEQTDEGVEIPQWARNKFGTNIKQYKKQAKSHEREINVDAVAESRLEDLGYL